MKYRLANSLFCHPYFVYISKKLSMFRQLLVLATAIFLISCNNNNDNKEIRQSADRFINGYTNEYAKLYTASSEAQWKANTEIRPGDSTNDVASQKAQEALAAFTGKKMVIDSTKYYLDHKADLTDLQVRQLNTILYTAGNNPETVKDLVKQRIKRETEAASKLYGFTYKLNGKPVSTNNIDDILHKEKNVQKRLDAWTASKEVGKALRSDLVAIRELRNRTVQALGYNDYFSYQVADYGMTTDEMVKLNEDFIRSIWPLYREIHTYFRYELAKQYNVDVPEFLPAHWLPNRWGQDWGDLVEVKGANIDSALKNLTAKDIIARGEKFYMSLGYGQLPQTFWDKSSLYPFPPDSAVKKNNHASAWHMDLENDLRSLMSVEPNAEWWETVHHELGHIFYYQAYSTPEVPKLLRGGANRGYHEAIGSLIGLASMQLPYLQSQNIFSADAKEDSMQKLFKEALNYIVFIPWSSGVMTHFERDLYAGNLDSNRLNSNWWDLVKKYQGIVPPSARGEEYCDATTKTHIIDDPAQYYDYAISYCLLMQMHVHIANKILHQNPHATNYYGSKETGDFLRSIMKWGQARDWRQVLKESTGDELNANAMMEYFKPLMQWLQEKNQGRKYSLSETMN
jgi:peptidyl-dipeptidase A